jgi:hypothetical protein
MPEFTGIEPYTTWDGAFTPDELDAIVAYGDAPVSYTPLTLPTTPYV